MFFIVIVLIVSVYIVLNKEIEDKYRVGWFIFTAVALLLYALISWIS